MTEIRCGESIAQRFSAVLFRRASLAAGLVFLCLPGKGWAFENRVSIEESGGYRIVRSNGIPDHAPGQFPNAGNPNTIREQDYTFQMRLSPQVAAQTTEVQPNLFGVALNGVPFDPGTAEFWNGDFSAGWNYDALSGQINLGLDSNNAHVQPTGAYHYHGVPMGLAKRVASGDDMTMVGYAADGFPVYAVFGYRDPMDVESGIGQLHSSYQVRDGQRPGGTEGPGGAFDGTFVQDFIYVAGSGDLDECNGRFGVTPEYPEGSYYYVLTTEFPFIPRLWRGEPDPSFQRHGPPAGGFEGHRRNGGRRGPPHGGPPPGMDSRSGEPPPDYHDLW